MAVTLAVVVSVTSIWTTHASADTMTQLDASQVVAEMGAGWNLGNSLEANSNGYPSETAWNNPTVTQALIDSVQAAGFDTIRIPVSYLNYIGPGPDYNIDSSWLNRVQEVVDYAYDRGLYVVINMHGDGYHTINGAWLLCDASDQTTIKAKYQRAWQQIATRFQDYDERLILESMNENFDGQYGNPTQPCYSNINDYNQIFVDTVRQTGGNNTSRWLLVPGWNTNIDYTAGDYGFEIPSDNHRSSSIPGDEQRIMISVHYYAPWDFAGEENGNITQWGPNATDSSRTSTWGQEDYMESQLQKTYDAFVTRGYPVVVGEWGSIDKSSHDSSNSQYREDFAHTMVSTADQYGAATIYWDNGVNGQYGFGLFNRSSNAVTQPGIVDAIMSALGDDDPVDPDPEGAVLARHSGKCLDVEGASTSDGAAIAQYTCQGGTNQQWQVQDAGDGYVRLVAAHSGKCIDVEGASTANGADILQWSCHGGANQQWQVQDAGGGYVRLVARHSGRCLDVEGVSTADGARILQWDCGSGHNQQWQIG